MKPQELSDALQFLDDPILAETAGALKKRPLRARPFALAAAAACIGMAALFFASLPKEPLPASLPGAHGTGGAHGNSALPGESAPSPVSGAEGPHSPAPAPGADGGAPARADLQPEYIESVLNGAVPAHGEADPSLPILALDPKSFAGGMGFEGYMAYDISELENGGPWRLGDAIGTLPVYRNPLTYDDAHIARGVNFDKMRALLLDAAAGLGLDEAQLAVYDDSPDESTRDAIQKKFAEVGEEVPEGYFDPTSLMAGADGVQLEIDAGLTLTVRFEPTRPLPEGCALSHGSARAEVAAAGAAVLEQYGALIGYEAPEAALDAGDRSYDGVQGYELHIYDASGDAARRLENYWLDYWNFYADDSGGLWLARHWLSDRSEKLGDYPIVTPAEAWQLLQNGNYLTSVPEPAPEGALPARVDLLYRSESSAQVFMPYYRFLMELPDMERDGLKNYGAYYVPAVQSDYLDGLPVWDGSFN